MAMPTPAPGFPLPAQPESGGKPGGQLNSKQKTVLGGGGMVALFLIVTMIATVVSPTEAKPAEAKPAPTVTVTVTATLTLTAPPPVATQPPRGVADAGSRATDGASP
ncbi:hypothetical protein ACGFNX_39785 [Streptomyces sp. NPDC048723]|uniref:hypothetical protein n=1 Tax=Streptomyces sp. NPDC048723 TaxID=3365589 RepID=UPI0037116BFD